jgi:hypothetical protein
MLRGAVGAVVRDDSPDLVAGTVAEDDLRAPRIVKGKLPRATPS